MKKFILLLALISLFGCASLPDNRPGENIDLSQEGKIDFAKLIELYLKTQENKTGDQGPVIPSPIAQVPVSPPPVFPTEPIVEPPPVSQEVKDYIVEDMETVPERLRASGFQGSDNALYYALAFVAAFGPGGSMPDDGAGSLAVLNSQQAEIEKWFDGEINKAGDFLKANPQSTATAIKNDGRDRCGFRLGPAILDRLKDFEGRVQIGSIVPDSEY